MKEEIYKYIEKYGPIRPSTILRAINTSEVTLFKVLKYLLESEAIKKDGRDSGVYYYVNNQKIVNNKDRKILDTIKDFDKYIIDKNYIYVDPVGNIIRGIQGFQIWCSKVNLNIETEVKSYVKFIKDLNKIKKNGAIEAKKNILSQNKNKEIHLNQIFYSDFYNVGHYGKTRLGQLVYVAKSAQNKSLIKEIAKDIYSTLVKIVEDKNIKYIAYIPPTIKRQVQFISELEKSLHLVEDFNLTKLKIEKIKSETLIAQKTLKKLEDRIYNANHTIIVNPNQIINGNVLLIDDATGSGATLNETAKKIKAISDHKVYGYSIVGSMKGFDVINEI